MEEEILLQSSLFHSHTHLLSSDRKFGFWARQRNTAERTYSFHNNMSMHIPFLPQYLYFSLLFFHFVVVVMSWWKKKTNLCCIWCSVLEYIDWQRQILNGVPYVTNTIRSHAWRVAQCTAISDSLERNLRKIQRQQKKKRRECSMRYFTVFSLNIAMSFEYLFLSFDSHSHILPMCTEYIFICWNKLKNEKGGFHSFSSSITNFFFCILLLSFRMCCCWSLQRLKEIYCQRHIVVKGNKSQSERVKYIIIVIKRRRKKTYIWNGTRFKCAFSYLSLLLPSLGNGNPIDI